jgi:hypothetical protein
MRAVITGTDFVRDNDGSFKAIETNTNIHPAVDLRYYFDVNVLDTIISGTSINEIHLINKRNLRSGYAREIDLTPESENLEAGLPNSISTGMFSTPLQKYCDEKGFTFNNILLDANSMTIPHIEDSDNKLIIRIAYDVTALIDDTYARDNWEFLKLMYDSNPSSIPATFVNDIELGFDSIGLIIRDNGIHPNYIVKKRITPADNHIYPKFYKINSIEELNILKTNLESDEYIQEYILNEDDLLEGRLTHYRSVDLIYGANLDILNFWNVQFSNAFELDNICDLDDENKIPIWERPKYFYKYNNNEKAPKISADGSTKVFLPDNSLTLLSSLNLNDTVKSISIPDLPLNEAEFSLATWTGSSENLMQNFTIGTTNLVDIVKRQNYIGFFYNVELTDGIKFSDVDHAMVLKKEIITGETSNQEIVKFVEYNKLQPGDTMIIFDSQTNSLSEKIIQNITFSYDEVEVYAVNFEQLDLFLTSEESGLRYGLLTHNYTFDCKSVTANCLSCYECSNGAYAQYGGAQCCRCSPGGANYGDCVYYWLANCKQFPCYSYWNPGAACNTNGYCNYAKSDIIHKENIQFVGKSPSGINIYRFNYKGEEGLYEGVIGNELIGTEFEHAVIYDEKDNTILVDYYKIYVQFKKLD